VPAGTSRSADAEPDDDSGWARLAALDVWSRLARADFAGWDPYDALNARWVPSAALRSRFVRRALTQAVKRSPLPLQPLLGVKRQTDAYTLGHALLAAARLGGDLGGAGPAGAAWPGGDLGGACTSCAELCAGLVARLRAMALESGAGLGWAYHFPVHTRFFSYAPSTPNLIVTAFVAKGLAAATRAGLADCAAEVHAAATFILQGLPRVTDQTGQCIGYVPGHPTVIHNANLLAALVLCEAAALGGDESWVDEARVCARFTAARQAADGSWPYSEEPYGRWVDGFHTGFVLEGLARVVRATDDAHLRESLGRGVRFYVAQLFGPEGEPKYYPHRARPFDALAAAQGVETLHVALGGPAAHAVPGQLEWIRRHLLGPSGRAAYQVHRGWTDRREFPRWAGAPLMSALAGVSPQAAAYAAPAAGAPATVALSQAGGL
jgi:hypothetical protein